MAACGGSVPPSSGATSAELAAYQAVGQDLADSVQTYSVQSSTSPSQSSCQQVQAQYDNAAGPLVERMREMSRDMDRHMDGLGSHDLADMECVARAMATEMERHRTEACTATDPATNQAEATHHATTMVDWAEHQRVRYQDLAAMSGMMQAHTEGTFTCQANPDGTFTFTHGGTQTHYPDPAHQGGSTPCPSPNPWPAPCHDSPCHPESGGMH